MRHLRLVAILLFATANQLSAQKTWDAKNMEVVADSLYKQDNYSLAAKYYLDAATFQDFDVKKRNMYYNAACCLALSNKQDSALLMLKRAVELGYTNKDHISGDPDLESIHTHPEWGKLITGIKEAGRSLNSDPSQVKFVTEDVHRFWDAYDKAYADTVNFKRVFTELYFDKASQGMKDYMAIKVGSIDFFLKHIRSAPAFYESIRKSTLSIDDFKSDFKLSFSSFKQIYPQAKFPDVYFVIGALTSGGTVSDAGLLIGLNQFSQSKNTVVDEFDEKKRMMLNESRLLPNLIAHELIHFQQQGMKRDTSTLGAAIKVGMADFLGELISGATANPRLFEWAQGREKSI